MFVIFPGATDKVIYLALPFLCPMFTVFVLVLLGFAWFPYWVKENKTYYRDVVIVFVILERNGNSLKGRELKHISARSMF